MKKVLLAIVAVMMTASVSAQRREFKPEEMATRQATQIKETCSTSDEQYNALYKLFLDNANKMKAQRDSISAAGGDLRQGFDRETWRKRQEEQNAAIKAILTEEQFAAYQKANEERRQRMGQRGNGQRRQWNQQ